METFLNRLVRGMALLSGIFLVAIMVIMFVDVIGRYFFHAPLTFSVELVELGMGLFVMFGLPQCTLARGHISVDLLTGRILGRVLDRAFDILASIAALIFMALIAWRLLLHAKRTYDDGRFTQILEMPVYPVVFLMFAASVVATLVALALVVRPSIGGQHLADSGTQT